SASRTEVFRYVRWPSSLPYLFSAMRIASTSSVLGALVAEWIGTNTGLGYLIVLTTYDFRTALLYAAMVVTSAIALAFFFMVSTLEWLLVRGGGRGRDNRDGKGERAGPTDSRGRRDGRSRGRRRTGRPGGRRRRRAGGRRGDAARALRLSRRPGLRRHGPAPRRHVRRAGGVR